METYQAITSWALFLGLGVFCALYYWPDTQRRQQQSSASSRTASERSEKRPQSYAEAARAIGSKGLKQNTSSSSSSSSTGEAARRRNAAENKKPQTAKKAGAVATTATAPPSAVVSGNYADEEPEVDSSTKQFAEQMLKARKGEVITGTRSQEQRIRTVKQSSAANAATSTTNAAATDDDVTAAPQATTTAFASGDVSDMLEPASAGPSVVRVTAPTNPQHQRNVPRNTSAKEEPESKKQRQNRKKVEEKRLAREAEEEERRVMMEKQRRGAREARGEPARNGVPASYVPASTPTTNSVWTTSTAAPAVNEAPLASASASRAAGVVNGAQSTTLLDTFDAESTSSSNGAINGISTAATSTTDGAGRQWGDNELPSEEEQMAQAMKESGDESGWTTVAVPKKQQKKQQNNGNNKSNGGEETPVPAATAAAAPAKTSTKGPAAVGNGKAKGGFGALEVQYDSSPAATTGADPNDPDNWEA